jgi:hypothetical protein
MPRFRTETFSTGDMSWLGSDHGIENSRTVTVDISTFTAGTHYPNGFIPSGLPVAVVGGVAVPYDSNEATTTGAGILAGHILTDQPVIGTGDFGAPLFSHGRVVASKLPIAFTKPAAAAKNAAHNIEYV